MGQASSVPPNHWYTRLIFASHSLSDNIISCPDLGVIYRVSTPRTFGIFPSGATSVFRKDRNTQDEILVAEMEKHSFSRDRVRMVAGYGPDVPFVDEGDYLMRTGTWSSKRSFRASNGRYYVWRLRDGKLQLYRDEDKYTPIARLSVGGLFSSSPMHIKLAYGSEEILDEVIVTCMIMEKRRRRQRNSSAAAAGGAGGAAGGGGGGGC